MAKRLKDALENPETPDAAGTGEAGASGTKVQRVEGEAAESTTKPPSSSIAAAKQLAADAAARFTGL